MTENWRPVVGFEGLYEISDFGKCRNVLRDRAVKPYMRGSYPAVTFHKSGSRRIRALHIAVLEAFKGPRPLGYVGAHLDGDTSNARLENLDWVTAQENERHKIAHGTAKQGEKSHHAKFDEEQVAIIRRARDLGVTAKELAVLLRVHQQTIFAILNGSTYPKHEHAVGEAEAPR